MLLELDADEGTALLLFGFEQEEDRLLFQRWVAGPQFSVSFEEFKAALRPKPQKPDKEVLADVEQIVNAFSGGKRYGDI